jgi:hypothetical protein
MNNLVPAGTAARGRRPASIDPQTVRERVRDLVKELHARHRRAGEDELAARLVERLEEDSEALQIAARFVVCVVLNEAKPRRRRLTGETSQADRRTEVKTQARAIAAKAREVILLNSMVTLATGEQKQLRYMTKDELTRLGGLYIHLAARLETPNELCEERWTEGEVKALLQAVV